MQKVIKTNHYLNGNRVSEATFTETLGCTTSAFQALFNPLNIAKDEN